MAEAIYQLTQFSDSPCYSHIIWLDENDGVKFNEHLVFVGQKPFEGEWFKEVYQKGIARYCLLYYDGLPVSRGAVEPYSDRAWEAADIRTAKDYRGRGFAKEILRFLSQYIISQGKTATCRTEEDNVAMKKVMRSIGYKGLEE